MFDEKLPRFITVARGNHVESPIVMPVESGPTIAERLRRYFPNVSVLYMSGYTDTALGPYGVLEPGIALLHKPFPSGELLSTVREILDTHGSSGLSTS